MHNNTPVFIIAEAGVNHNGSIDMALQLVDAAAAAGADAVKFQTFIAENLVSKYADKANYQQQSTDATENQLTMLKQLELSKQDHQKIIERCCNADITFLSSPFDHTSLDLLVNNFGLSQIKLGSGELTNAPLLLAAARSGRSIILSTGMATLAEVESALSVLAFGYLNKTIDPCMDAFACSYASEEGKQRLQNKVTLLHCTTEYPAPYVETNLRAMDTLAHVFSLPVGYSDHTDGWAIPLAAVARGATVIEKHFTLDRKLSGPDHRASLEPDALKKMIESIRQIEMALGSGVKQAAPSEEKNRPMVRKSLVAAMNIACGERFSRQNLTVKRPGYGVSPFQYWDYLGRPASRSYSYDEVIEN